MWALLKRYENFRVKQEWRSQCCAIPVLPCIECAKKVRALGSPFFSISLQTLQNSPLILSFTFPATIAGTWPLEFPRGIFFRVDRFPSQFSFAYFPFFQVIIHECVLKQITTGSGVLNGVTKQKKPRRISILRGLFWWELVDSNGRKSCFRKWLHCFGRTIPAICRNDSACSAEFLTRFRRTGSRKRGPHTRHK